MNQQRENCPQLAPWKYSCRLGSGISAMVLSIPALARHQPGLTLPAPKLCPRSCSYYTDGARMLLKSLTIDSLVQGRPENSAGLGQGQVFGGNSAAGPSWREGPTAELLPKNEAVAVAFFFFFFFFCCLRQCLYSPGGDPRLWQHFSGGSFTRCTEGPAAEDPERVKDPPPKCPARRAPVGPGANCLPPPPPGAALA